MNTREALDRYDRVIKQRHVVLRVSRRQRTPKYWAAYCRERKRALEEVHAAYANEFGVRAQFVDINTIRRNVSA